MGFKQYLVAAVAIAGMSAGSVAGWAQDVGTPSAVGAPEAPLVQTIPGMPAVPNPSNLYSETGVGHIAPDVAQDPARVYVPNLRSNDVYVIDPATNKVVDRFPVGKSPQHVVPSWDLRTLWVTNNAEGTIHGSLTPIDPRTAVHCGG